MPGVARRRGSFFARAKKEPKESTPRFAALRVPSIGSTDWAAAQLALACGSELRQCSPTSPQSFEPIEAAQMGKNKPSQTVARASLGRAEKRSAFRRLHAAHYACG